MQAADIVIAGAGLAGSIAATTLAEAGYAVTLVDPHDVYPDDFRCEKLGGRQVDLLRKLNMDFVLDEFATSFSGEWIARYGHVVETRRTVQYGIDYGRFVNSIRERMPENITFVQAKVTGIETSADQQLAVLSNGCTLSSRLIIIANGLNSGLRQSLGMPRHDVSPCHSISAGFDLEPADDGAAFPFPALTYYSEGPQDHVGYLTLFPIGQRMRANLFFYRSLNDPWLKDLKSDPAATLSATLPNLSALTGRFKISGQVKIRPIDLYETQNPVRDGVVLVGDAVRTACPAAGTGVIKLLTDVDQLCSVYVPSWLATPGLQAEKIAKYYVDAQRCASDEKSTTKAYFAKALSLSDAPVWKARRAARYAAGRMAGSVASAQASLQPVAAQLAAFFMI